jgi:hypothetical protein
VVPRNVTVKAARYGGSEALEVRLAGQWRGPDMSGAREVPSASQRMDQDVCALTWGAR